MNDLLLPITTGAIRREITYSPHRLEFTAICGEDVVIAKTTTPTLWPSIVRETLQDEITIQELAE